MYPFVPIKNVQETPQYRVVKQFVTEPFWEDEADVLFADDVSVELPHAVPGFPQYFMNPYEFHGFRDWLKQTVSHPDQVMEPCIIPTTDPNLFWAIRFVKADVHWALRDGKFECEIVSRIILKDGKISHLRDYANPMSFYRAIGIVLPNFNYLQDIVSEAENVRMHEGASSHFTYEENVQRAINNFANPIDGHDDDPESIYAHDLVEINPFVPHDMPEYYSGKDFDIQTEWMFRNVKEWNTPKKVPFYQSVDPNIFIVESYGFGHMTWSNCDGHYTQRELQIVHLNDEGKIDHFRVYFNCLNKFYSMNQMIPAFPYYNF